MFLLIGDDEDLLCHDLSRALGRKASTTRILDDVFGTSTKLIWSIGSRESSSTLRFGDGSSLAGKDIQGVLIRKPSFNINAGWDAEYATYVRAEKEAGLLGWIWSLDCPIINRYSPELWLEPAQPLSFWRGRLEPFGLELADPGEAGRRGDPIGLGGENKERESEPREDGASSYLAAVIRRRVIWDQSTPFESTGIEEGLSRFAESLGLTYIECRATYLDGRWRIARVEPFPTYDQFCFGSRGEIIRELLAFLAVADIAR